ncbi:MAG: methylated-DNA--[protein]-cysteine S-methyltransferase [Salegentibacter sp.]|uniref:Methylated-DNA--protein-cysteine methyltransferase n=1 Tax=Salegentibacter flavus TaxID=287099 RepID=A0A1I4ZZG0_9FLAO|nr:MULTISPECIES: methylated-DNA--[protein]-cysteine S-methyltransferase [Salegentibacter]MDR9457560.1 methylated-DNA--[protein]-cysteine S-methyltransferase [Salegentibacter sp.]SFN55538.1 methylated-DNA-[protein]-cysteine S-methyltransferase [Salegentibacter flavus]
MKIHLKTPLGVAKISGSEEGVSEIKILDESPQPSSEIPDVLLPVVEQLEAYFRGELEEFNLKLDLEGTNFQKKVWRALLKIPYGKTVSYLELSKQIGDVKAIRAVASANGRNPLWIVIPCHRVIGSGGSLTGYAGGLHRKKWLLEHEGALTQQSLF